MDSEADARLEAVAPGSVAPIACTLGKRQAADQVLEWVDLQGHAIKATAIDGGASVTFPASLAADVEDLARREVTCCSFLTIETSVADDVLTLDISSPSEDALPLILMLAGLSTP